MDTEAAISSFLTSLEWPIGLQATIKGSCRVCPLRYFIIDDSGSMSTNDGHMIVGERRTRKFVNCSRWSELCQSIKFHATYAHISKTPTQFRLLNAANSIVIGQRESSDVNLNTLLALLDGSPNGGTPLCAQIRSVIADINQARDTLIRNGQKAVVVIATDGESSDGDMAEAMRPLQYLPVHVVIKLCSDDEKICTYWNDIDKNLELDMDILDDFLGEAKEINQLNNWFVYGEPLHRLREWGVTVKEFDMLDEAKLSSDQVRAFCAYLFLGGNPQEVPHPAENYVKFEEFVHNLCSREKPIWDPLIGKENSWINFRNLNYAYNPSPGWCVIS
jgi:hypothetical protein